MSFAQDEELLKEFLVEAGEILEQLGEQLVELEQSPEDLDLLNSIFRAFHTIKGGAGFLEITPLVDLCHHAEDVFGVLRQGERQADAGIMDVILKAYDALQAMFVRITGGDLALDPPDPALMAALAGLLEDGDATTQAAGATEQPAETGNEETTEELVFNGAGESGSAAGELTLFADEYGPPTVNEADDGSAGTSMETGPFVLLDDTPSGSGDRGREDASETIDEDEFEALLDELHGKAPPGAGPSATPSGDAVAQTVEAKTTVAKESVATPPARPASAGGQPAPLTEPTVRVDTRRLDEIMNLVGELVLARNRLLVLRGIHGDESLVSAVDHLDIVTADLQTAVMKTRMQPIRKVFGRFPRVVRDLARSLGKDVKLEMHGEETELDKNLVEALSDPLVHLVRNALDHGIEAPDRREAAGKPRTGTLRLVASQEGDHIELLIADDGGGMDADRLRATAVERGLLDAEAAARLSEADCFHLIFEPGFSTCQEVSDISGRGVGMDVVRTRINELNGSITIDSEKGSGTTITICLPLTMAIMPTLMVGLSKQVFALPLGSIDEIINRQETQNVDGQEVMLTRNQPLPILPLRSWAEGRACPTAEDDQGRHVVVVNLGSRRVGLVVDELFGQEDVVIKPLGRMLHGLAGLAGATITGDGRVSLILDVPGIVEHYAANQ